MSALRPDSRYSTRDVENTIAFLQAEHSKILDGLHEQIRHLQQKCAQLTFELAMQSTSSQETGVAAKDVDCSADVREDQDHIEKDSCSVKPNVLTLQATLSAKEDKIVSLEEELKETHDSLLCERRAKEELSQSLHSKADTIANLMTQLHKEKQKSKKVIEQLKLYGDSTLEQSSFQRRSGSAKMQMTVKYPAGHHTSDSSSMTPPLRRMPHPPTTPPPASSNHIRRATTPTKDLPLRRRQGSSCRRKLPTVPQATTFSDISYHSTEQAYQHGRLHSDHELALNPLGKEEAPGYKEIISNHEESQVRPSTQSRQFPVLPPIEGDPDAGTKRSTIEEEPNMYVHRVKSHQGLGSAKVNQSVRLEPNGQQAWVHQLSPQSDSQ